MITTSNLTSPTRAPEKRSAVVRLASIDVEWTKNYRIKNGNRPFCYSVVWLDLPTGVRDPSDLADVPFHFTSVYVEDADEQPALVRSAANALRTATNSADLITGHQLCSDLAVLAATADRPQPTIDQARASWKQRNAPAEGDPRYLDTRFDAGHLLTGTSRRLVDVCTELRLDVTQPELRGTSMTALHRRWLTEADATAREKISVLNLRHSLSTAYVAAHAAGLGHWAPEGLNVNRVLAATTTGAWDWLASPTFHSLLGEPCLSATAP
ncbi:hypothetical protein FH609_020275 [Streptomyces sp. 3MP-14]|uniref:3'-5' exonuclease n=1 Tax=Streptomyces mimosae TaxID=2586635 RepID=A0A5N5ZZA6_9ACTN|nr:MULTISPECIES: hypothetical protein [Streptomyces]KAB8161811.1 hypothetical protein FH607_024145 [Streptomyces mimosae]KAB8174921.1 hypothetical protein FH609_020275 [Streptomyces sp. 3MP-14]